ncbi:Cholesterol dehydrogenase [Hafnia alvei]|nr:Cholesterol dehydrogenase [Hafnia alvei]
MNYAMNKTVAVTGGTGFIGKHIVDNLLARGLSVRALTRTARSDTRSNITWICGRLEDPNSLAKFVDGANFVVHCAGQVRGHNEDIFTQCNVTGSLHVMRAAKESGSCERFLFMSSLAARYPELSWYANSKYIAEQRLIDMASDMSLGIFRPTAVYGPGDKELKPLFSWMLRGILLRLSSVETRLSLLHVSDLAEAVSQWLTTEQPQSHPYELCDGVSDGYDWNRIQEIGASIRNGSVQLVGVPLPLLKLIANVSTLASYLSGKEPMLTRSKIRELTHIDWSASNKTLSEHINWLPKIDLDYALRNGLF